MAQTAPDHPPDHSSEKGSKAYEDTRSRMQAHCAILKGIHNDLRSTNLRKIKDQEVERYIGLIDTIINYVINPENASMMLSFVKAIEKFEKMGGLVIRILNNALTTWENFNKSDISMKDKSDGERVYEDRLDECRTEIGKLLNEFRNL
jgi:hypothetical protein